MSPVFPTSLWSLTVEAYLSLPNIPLLTLGKYGKVNHVVILCIGLRCVTQFVMVEEPFAWAGLPSSHLEMSRHIPRWPDFEGFTMSSYKSSKNVIWPQFFENLVTIGASDLATLDDHTETWQPWPVLVVPNTYYIPCRYTFTSLYQCNKPCFMIISSKRQFLPYRA